MEFALAAHVAERVRACADLLSMSVTLVKLYLSDSELAAYRLRVSKAVGEMGFSVLFPIYQHFPQLKPEPQARPNPIGSEMLGADVAEDPDKLAEIVLNLREKVRTELLDVLKAVRPRIEPQEASEITERFQAVLELVSDIRVET